ncbi:septal ring lytic transglycosylase RlpA family protein [Flindersiella endophytica]
MIAILVPAFLIIGGAFALTIGKDQKPAAVGAVDSVGALAGRDRQEASRGTERSDLPAARSGKRAPKPTATPKSTPTPSGKPSIKRKTAKTATPGYSVRYTSPNCSATYFGDSTEYQPLANGGNSTTTTHGVALWDWSFGTKVRITSLETGKSVIAPVVDRGPASWTGNCIDLLPDTWDDLGVSRSQGEQDVRYEILRAN